MLFKLMLCIVAAIIGCVLAIAVGEKLVGALIVVVAFIIGLAVLRNSNGPKSGQSRTWEQRNEP